MARAGRDKRSVNRQIGKSAGRQIGKSAGRQIGKSAGRQIGKSAGRQIGRSANYKLETRNLTPNTQRPIPNTRTWLAWGWFLVGVVLVLGAWTSPYTQPRHVILHGVPPDGQAEVGRCLLQNWRTPFALYSGYGRLEEALQKIAWLDGARVRGDLKGTLNVSIHCREPFASLETPTRTVWLDSEGVAFVPPGQPPLRGERRKVKGESPKPQTPSPKPDGDSANQMKNSEKSLSDRNSDFRQIIADYDPIMTLGERVQDSSVRSALQVLVQLNQQEVSERVAIRIDRGRKMCLNILGPLQEGAEPGTVRLGDSGNLQDKVRVLKQLYQTEPHLLAQCEYVDLSCPSAPAVKMRVESRN